MKFNIARTLNMAALKIKKVSPEILVVAGIAGVVTSTVMACKATTKVNDILEPTAKELEKIHNTAEKVEAGEVVELKNGGTYTMKDVRNDTFITYAQAGAKLAKLYGPAVIIGVASIGCIVGSHNILSKRNAALCAAYGAVDRSFKEYRSRVVERFGKELDQELRLNVKSKEIETKDEETGEVKKEVVTTAQPTHSDYARCYTVGCKGWTKDPETNLFFLKRQQDWANEKLKSRGWLLLNEVYEMLGLPVSRNYGMIVGWIYDEKCPNGDNYVDFGIYNNNKGCYEFVNGEEASIWLDFNVDGPIYDMI